MTRILTLTVGATFIAAGANAGGIDRNGQPISFIFEEGTFVEIGIGSVSPSISGVDLPFFAVPGGGPSGNIAKPIAPLTFSIKTDITDKLSFGVLYDQPFGAEIEYGLGSLLFGGTTARAEISAVTALMRYEFTDRFSAHGGLRFQSGDADVTFTGLANGAFSGYNVKLTNDTSIGYVAGVAYEIPEYFLRVALTYSSAITHKFQAIETVPRFPTSIATIESSTPQSVNLEFQTGIAPKTFVFGGARWVDWSELQFNPPVLLAVSGEGIVDFKDTVTYSLGVGRQFNEHWTGLFSLIYEPGVDPLVSVLAPTDGFWGATIGAVYSNKNLRITAGINYTQLGDAITEVGPDIPVGDFSGNESVGFGLKVGWSF